MSRRSRRARQPNTTRATVPSGSQARPIQAGPINPGNAAGGMNTTPVAAYQPKSGSPGYTLFSPGDPIRPIPGLDDGFGGPRQWAYPVGGNIYTQPRANESVGFEQLRNVAALAYGVQLCERVIFRIIQRLEIAITPKAQYLDSADDASKPQWTEPAKYMQEWLQEPDHRGTDLNDWLVAATRDLLEIDALGIYHRPTRNGNLYGLELVAGDTIAIRYDAGGRIALPPAPAFQQVVYGSPGLLFSSNEMDYIKEIHRTDNLYGVSPVESVLLTVNQALRKQSYDLRRYTDGATPTGVLQTSNAALFNLTAEQIQGFEMMWNAILAGNDQLRHRTKVVPPGFTFQSLQENAIATDFDRWLLNIIVAAFGLTMDEIAMTETSNRSVGESQEHVIYRNAVQPRTALLARYMTRKVIARYDGMPLSATNATVSRAKAPTKAKLGTWDRRYQVEWRGIDEPEDLNAKITAAGQLVDKGIMGRTEAKRWLGLPVAPNEPEIPAATAVQGGVEGVVFWEDAVDQRGLVKQQLQTKVDTATATLKISTDQGKQLDDQLQQNAAQAASDVPPDDSADPSDDASTNDADATSDDSGSSATKKTSRTAVADEWRRYRDVALRAVKRGQPVKPFISTILPHDEHAVVAQHLLSASTPEEVRTVFSAARTAPSPAAPDAIKHTGCMVALYLPSSLGQQVAIPGGEPISDLHITLAFLGDTTEVAIDHSALNLCVARWAHAQQPFMIDIAGLGRFTGDGVVSPIYATVASDDLMAARSTLVTALAAAGFTVSRDYAYTPHVTLLYLTADDPMPDLRLPPLHTTIGQVTVAYGGDLTTYPLSAGQTPPVPDATDAVVAELRALKAAIVRGMDGYR